MPPLQHQNAKTPVFDYVVLALLIGFVLLFGYRFTLMSTVGQFTVGSIVLVWCGISTVLDRRTRRRVEAIVRSRDKESICDFARSFNTRQVDTWIIRASHQELQKLMQAYVAVANFPIRAGDSLAGDLRLDSDDVDDLFQDIAERTGRSLDHTDQNPFYGKVRTVWDLASCVNAQPRVGG